MISLEKIVDGSPTARNFEALQRLVPDTGGLSVRVRSGKVAADGTLALGTGFTPSRSAAGTYTVTIGFDHIPVVVATSGDTAGKFAVKVTAQSTTAFSILTYDTATGANTDCSFNWVAIG